MTRPAPDGGDAPRRYPRSVLVVDDDPSVRTLLEMVLEVEGFAVRCSPDGADALEQIAAQRPDVVLVDVMMPGVDGRALTRQLREDPGPRTCPSSSARGSRTTPRSGRPGRPAPTPSCPSRSTSTDCWPSWPRPTPARSSRAPDAGGRTPAPMCHRKTARPCLHGGLRRAHHACSPP